MNVLSLFDGMSCARQALERAGIKVDKYFASEIDKYAIQVTMANYPNTIQLGSVTKISIKTILLSEVYSYISSKYFNYDIQNLQSIISEREMLHRVNEEQTFAAYFGTQVQNENTKVSEYSCLSINDRIWFYKREMGSNKGVYDIVRCGERGKISDIIDVGDLCKHSFWWNGYGQSEPGIKEKSIGRAKRIKENGGNEAKIKRDSNETIFNERSKGTSTKESFRAISGSDKKTEFLNCNVENRPQNKCGEKEENRGSEKANQIFKNERVLQTNNEVFRISETDGILLSIYNETQATIIECEWGIIVFKGGVQATFGGSPCQSFSFAGKRKGMATKSEIEILNLEQYLFLKTQGFEFEGQSYLFWEYMRILKEVKPKYFLLENVLMGEKWQKILTQAIGINPIEINSALVSAQNRKRLYWTNISAAPIGFFDDLVCRIPQPKDKGILLKDVLESEVDEKYYLSDKMIAGFNNHKKRCDAKGTGFGWNPTDGNKKGSSLTLNNLRPGNDFIVHNTMPRSSTTGKGGTGPLSRADGKTYCLDTGQTNAVEFKCVAQRGRNPENPKSRIVGLPTEQKLEPREDGKTNCLTTVQKDNYVQIQNIQTKIRRLTPLECKRLQTVSDDYKMDMVSETQQYRMLGNGWNIDTILHILSFIK